MGSFVLLLQPLVCVPQDSCPSWACHCLSVNDNLPELSAESQSCSSQSCTSVFANSRAGRGGRGQETPHRWGTGPGPASAWAGRRRGEPEMEALSLSAKETSRDIGNMQLDTCVQEKRGARGAKSVSFPAGYIPCVALLHSHGARHGQEFILQNAQVCGGDGAQRCSLQVSLHITEVWKQSKCYQ